MTGWPPPPRTDPAYGLPERESLDTWLEFHRATLLTKCAGLSGEQLAARSCPPSTLSLLGLVRHMADVERTWFRHVLDGQDVPPLHWTDDEPDGDFDGVDPAHADRDLEAYLGEVAHARTIAAGHGLDDVGTRRGEQVDLRWILTHMIEEYARHNGHADLLRERIDGVTGE